MDIPSELLAQFQGVTNADETLASQLLRDSGLNLEAAISSFFAIQEAGGLPVSPQNVSPPTEPAEQTNRALPPSTSGDPIDVDSPTVRAPIPQIVDTLLPPRPPPRNTHIPDPFEQDGTARGDGLAALFRPPTHLTYAGSFEDAMSAGNRRKLWLLVNIQRNDIFACLAMNRDVWSDVALQSLLEAHFIFWQVDERTPEGGHYKRYYPYQQTPHIAIIDPRSGERVRVWGGDGDPVQRRVLIQELEDFITRNSLESDGAVRNVGAGASSRTDAPKTEVDTESDVRMTEEDQLAAAIALSIEASRGTSTPGEGNGGISSANGSSMGDMERHASRLMSATNPALNQNRSIRAQQDNAFEESLALDRAKEESEKSEIVRKQNEEREERMRAERLAEVRERKRKRVPIPPPEGIKKGVTELVIRLPDGKRLQRRFNAIDNIGNVYDFVESEVEGLREGSFELIQVYPKKNFVDREELLDGLAPKAALVVGLKD